MIDLKSSPGSGHSSGRPTRCLKYVAQRKSTYLHMMTYDTRDQPSDCKYNRQLTERSRYVIKNSSPT